MKTRPLLIVVAVLFSLAGTPLLDVATGNAETSPEADRSRLELLLILRIHSAQVTYAAAKSAYDAGTIPFDSLSNANRQLTDAWLATAKEDEQKIAALTASLERAKEQEQQVRKPGTGGVVGGGSVGYDIAQARYERETAEIALLRARVGR